KLDELYVVMYQICFFFFQAEDGIRDRNVTGVQTCALPISAGDQFNYKIIFIPKIESFNIEYDLAHHPRVLQAVECLFEIGKRIGPVHDRPDFMLFDEFKHFMQLLCTRHGGAEKIVLPIEEFLRSKSTVSPADAPNAVSVPPRRNWPTDLLNVAAPTLSITTSTFSPESSSFQSASLSIALSAPSSSACMRFSSDLHCTSTFAPAAFANCSRNVPAPPVAPGMRTVMPSLTFARVKSARYAVMADSARTPASSQERCPGLGTAFSAGRVIYSANVPSKGIPTISKP